MTDTGVGITLIGEAAKAYVIFKYAELFVLAPLLFIILFGLGWLIRFIVKDIAGK